MRRSELPAEIQDTSNWPRVDTSGFSQTMLDQYLAKERAVIDWLNGKSLRSVEARTGINRGTVQRAIVSPGANRLQFNNVPANILQAVLSQLY